MRILILCTGNSCRSQMAEGFFRHYGDGKIEAFSAGVAPIGVNEIAVRVMLDAGIDISGQTSDNLKKYVNDSFDYVITVCDKAKEACPVFSGAGNTLHWPFDDPYYASGTEEEILNEFRRVRDEIGGRIKTWLDKKNG